MLAEGKHDQFLGPRRLVARGENAGRRAGRVDQSDPNLHRAFDAGREVDQVLIAGGVADLGRVLVPGIPGPHRPAWETPGDGTVEVAPGRDIGHEGCYPFT